LSTSTVMASLCAVKEARQMSTIERISNLRAFTVAAAVLGATACAAATPRPDPAQTSTRSQAPSPPQKGTFRYDETPTQYVTVAGTRIAYRAVGTDAGEPPLVLLQHFTGTMDDWDPEVVEGLAIGRRVYVFDNAGVGASEGVTPDSIQAMAKVAEAFVDALDLETVDLLGFSMGGAVAQQFLIDRPAAVRKAVLAGTAAKGTPGAANLPAVVAEAFKRAAKERSHPKAFLFFTQTPSGKRAANQFVGRINRHTVDPDPPATEATTQAQLKAITMWSAAAPDDKALAAITQPVLVVNGSNDVMAPTVASYELYQRIPRAQLILYPDSGHGALFQYHDAFVAEVDWFLRSAQ
jgi:pimeloyl-ACP methyl ester carboxylesterase